jgi:hypothetical protein
MAIWIDKNGKERFRFDFDELVRLNRSSHALDLQDYDKWFATIPEHLKNDFIHSLFRYGTESNVGEHWARCLEWSGISENVTLVERFQTVAPKFSKSGHRHNFEDEEREIVKLIGELAATDRLCVMKLAAAYFAYNERAHFEGCKHPESQCNHWWHEDLTNPLVVENLRANRFHSNLCEKMRPSVFSRLLRLLGFQR